MYTVEWRKVCPSLWWRMPALGGQLAFMAWRIAVLLVDQIAFVLGCRPGEPDEAAAPRRQTGTRRAA